MEFPYCRKFAQNPILACRHGISRMTCSRFCESAAMRKDRAILRMRKSDTLERLDREEQHFD